MKKTLLALITFLLVPAAHMAAQDGYKKYRLMQQTLISAAAAETTANSCTLVKPVTAYYDGSLSVPNYYIVLADKTDATFNSSTATLEAKNCNTLCLDLYSGNTGTTSLPEGTYTPGTGENMTYSPDYSFSSYYDSKGNVANQALLTGNVEVVKDENGDYTITATTTDGTTYTYSGRLNFIDSNSDSYVYPQIRSDINTTFTGGLGIYNGNLYESKTGNMFINLFDCPFDPNTGAMQGTGVDVAICAFARLFPNSKKAVVQPGTYTMARNFAMYTYYPGMEIDYMGTTIVFGSYVKRRKAMTGADSDYDFTYIADGTITIEQDENGKYNITMDCLTADGFRVSGTATGIEIPIIDVSEDENVAFISNLDHDVDLDLDYIKTARSYKYTVTNGCQSYLLDIGSPSGKDGKEGDIMRMEFLVPEGTEEVLEGTYTVMSFSHLYTNMYEPFKLVQGYFYNQGDLSGTRYIHFEENRYNVMDFLAPALEGTVSVEKIKGTENYKFVIDLIDDVGYYIKGEWTGPIELCYETTGIDGFKSEQAPQIGYTGDGILSLSGVPSDSNVYIYSTDGRLVKKDRGASSINITTLPKGVYILKTTTTSPVKILKK